MTLTKSLQLLIKEVFTFTKKDFHLLSYLYTLLFIIICTYINYNTGFYQHVMCASYFSGNSLWAFPLFYSLVYFAVAIPLLLIQKDFKSLQKSDFYIKNHYQPT